MIVATDNDFEQLIFKLDRNQQGVSRLFRSLNSYRYEPKNYECYFKLRDLKKSCSSLAKDQAVLLDQLQQQSLSYNEGIERVERFIKEFEALEQRRLQYLSEQ